MHTRRLLSATLALLLVFGTACDSSDPDPDIDDTPARLTGTWTGVVVGTVVDDTPPEEQPVEITIVQGNEVDGAFRLERVLGTGVIQTETFGELTFDIQGDYFHPNLTLGLLFTVTPPIGTISGVVLEDRTTILATMAGPSIGGSVEFMLERQ